MRKRILRRARLNVERLDERLLLVGDIDTSPVYNVTDYHSAEIARHVNVPLETAVHSQVNRTIVEQNTPTLYIGQDIATEAYIEVNGMVWGRITHFDLSASGALCHSVMTVSGTIDASRDCRTSSATLTITGLGILDVKVWANAFTSRVYTYSSSGGSYEYSELETEAQLADANFRVHATGKWSLSLEVMVYANHLEFNRQASLINGQVVATVRQSLARVFLDVQGNSFIVDGKADTSSNQGFWVDDQGTEYRANNATAFTISGYGRLNADVQASHHKINGYNNKGWVRDNEYRAVTSLTWSSQWVRKTNFHADLFTSYLPLSDQRHQAVPFARRALSATIEVKTRGYLLPNPRALDYILALQDEIESLLCDIN